MRWWSESGVYEDGIDDLTPIIARAMTYLDDTGPVIEPTARPGIEAAPVDHLADIADALQRSACHALTEIRSDRGQPSEAIEA